MCASPPSRPPPAERARLQDLAELEVAKARQMLREARMLERSAMAAYKDAETDHIVTSAERDHAVAHHEHTVSVLDHDAAALDLDESHRRKDMAEEHHARIVARGSGPRQSLRRRASIAKDAIARAPRMKTREQLEAERAHFENLESAAEQAEEERQRLADQITKQEKAVADQLDGGAGGSKSLRRRLSNRFRRSFSGKRRTSTTAPS